MVLVTVLNDFIRSKLKKRKENKTSHKSGAGVPKI